MQCKHRFFVPFFGGGGGLAISCCGWTSNLYDNTLILFVALEKIITPRDWPFIPLLSVVTSLTCVEGRS